MSEGVVHFRLRSCPAAVVVFTLLAIAGNWLGIDLFFSVDFLFGGVFAMALLLLCGARWGILAAALSSLVTWQLWQHPYAVVIFTAEAVFVGSLLRGRIGRMFLLNMLYWLTFGVGLVFLFYYLVMGMELQAVILVALKQGVNGIFNAFCAVVLVLVVQLAGTPGGVRTRHTLRSTLQLVIVGFVLFPLLVEVIVTGRNQFSSLQDEIYQRVLEQQWTARVLTERSLLDAERQLQRFAGQLYGETTWHRGSAAVDRLQQFLSLYPRFESIELLENGKVAARAQAEPDGYAGTGQNVRLAVSLPGGHGSSRSGDTVLAAVMRPEFLLPLELPEGDEMGIQVLTGNGSSLTGVGAELPDSISSQDLMGRLDEGVYSLVPDMPEGISAMQRWRQTLYVSAGRVPLETGRYLTIAAYVRAAPYQKDLYGDYIRLFGLMAALLIASIAVSSFVANRFFRALRWINQAAADLPERVAEDQEPVWPDSMIQEFHMAAENFRRAGMSIRDMYQHVVQTNRELESARGAAEASSRAKGEFIAGMSHELRTPLNAIIGYSELLTSEVGEPVREYGDIIHTAGQHLLDMINSILLHAGTAAQQGPAEMRLISPQKLIQNAAGMFRVRAGQKGLQLRTDFDQASDEELYLPERSIMQVLMNLLANALRSTNEGELVLKSRRTPDGVLFSVADTGSGIPHPEQKRIFAPFYQVGTQGLAGKQEGLGLGLAICTQLLEAMGSHMELDSTPGQGTEFWFVVPAGAANGADAASGNPAEHSSAAELSVMLPPRELSARFRVAAERGDIAEIETLLSEEVDPCPEYADFAQEVRRLIKGFALKELSTLLQRGLTSE